MFPSKIITIKETEEEVAMTRTTTTFALVENRT